MKQLFLCSYLADIKNLFKSYAADKGLATICFLSLQPEMWRNIEITLMRQK